MRVARNNPRSRSAFVTRWRLSSVKRAQAVVRLLMRRSGGVLSRDQLDDMRDFMRLHLGDDWELLLILANAIASHDASDEAVHAAQQRAVALARLHSPAWNDDLSELVAYAWITLWADG